MSPEWVNPSLKKSAFRISVSDEMMRLSHPGASDDGSSLPGVSPYPPKGPSGVSSPGQFGPSYSPAHTDLVARVVFEGTPGSVPVFKIEGGWRDLNNEHRKVTVHLPIDSLAPPVLRSSQVMTLVAGTRAPSAVHRVMWEAWADLASALPSGEPPEPPVVPFLETATPVLARLEAEVEMCVDPMQKSRLAGVLKSLQRFAPSTSEAFHEASEPVSSKS